MFHPVTIYPVWHRHPMSKKVRLFLRLLSFSFLLFVGINLCFVQSGKTAIDNWHLVVRSDMAPARARDAAVFGHFPILCPFFSFEPHFLMLCPFFLFLLLFFLEKRSSFADLADHDNLFLFFSSFWLFPSFSQNFLPSLPLFFSSCALSLAAMVIAKGQKHLETLIYTICRADKYILLLVLTSSCLRPLVLLTMERRQAAPPPHLSALPAICLIQIPNTILDPNTKHHHYD